MFTVYHSNDLYIQKEMLLKAMQMAKPEDPFQPDIILVQSPGMAQWLQLQIADQYGVAANLQFPMPASFIWQQYQQTLSNVTEQHQFNKDSMTWRLMTLLQQEHFQPLQQYFQLSDKSDQLKCYQLASQLADLFDQYLVYRPEWILAWERGEDEEVERAILTQQPQLAEHIRSHVKWQGELWRALIQDIKQHLDLDVLHRAHLHQNYLTYLTKQRPDSLPQHLFIFGISALPQSYLATFKAMSQHCHIHLFFNNPCRYYWGDIVDPQYLQRLKLHSRQIYQQQSKQQLFSTTQLALLEQLQADSSLVDQQHLVGNPLLASWGKLGRDFLYALTEMENNEISAFSELESSGNNLLQQIQSRILNLSYQPFTLSAQDHSLVIQSCHSPMREVEVLHDYLLSLFQQDPNLTPRDIVVMVADIDHYAPYINAVFGQYRQDQRFIPFSLSDGRLTENDVLVTGFLTLLQLKDCYFSAEQLLELLDIPAIHQCFQIETNELEKIRYWVEQVGIRFGLNDQRNYNSWQKGLERMLLGQAMRSSNGIWQDSIGFDPSYGLKAAVVGPLMAFVERLDQWYQCLLQAHSITQWRVHLTSLLNDFFAINDSNRQILLYLQQTIDELANLLTECQFEQVIDIDVIAQVLADKLQNTQHSLKFLVGKVSFCTLLPMRAIPFKVICLLGMNDGDYPRHQPRNSFDLMQYHQQKGDRLRREDDRYLFLEALLSAQKQFYVSYVGRSIIDNRQKEPSVLVNQLLDYIGENCDEQNIDVRQRLVVQQPMQVFNPKNYLEKHRTFTFATQWQPLAGQRDYIISEFIQPLLQNITQQQEYIELAQLIAFVTHPVKYFFEQTLGVYFKQTATSIADQENFILNKLELFTINKQLLQQDEQQWQQYFDQLKVKGLLPKANFGQLYAQQIVQHVGQFKQHIEHYLKQSSQQQFVSLVINQTRLEGNINCLYGENKQRVAWRLGNIRDQDRIENWLYYLMLQASSSQYIEPAIFYGVNGKINQTPVLSQEEALAQLKIYVEAYIRSQQNLLLIPTKYLDEYFKLLRDPELDNSEQCEQYLYKMAIDDNYYFCSEDPYWQRVLAQTPVLNLEEINNEFLRWFRKMLVNKNESIA